MQHDAVLNLSLVTKFKGLVTRVEEEMYLEKGKVLYCTSTGCLLHIEARRVQHRVDNCSVLRTFSNNTLFHVYGVNWF